MKKKDIEKKLKKCGWRLERNGGNHDIWTNGDIKTPIPRHREVNERTAKSIIKKAEENKI